MKPPKRSPLARAGAKSSEPLRWEETLPLSDLILQSRQEIEAVSLNLSLKIMSRYMEAEIDRRQGPWGQQTHYRHGTQPGYVVFHGREASIPRPRLRAKGGGEAQLESDRLFQQDGRMQRAVARQLLRQVSTRNHADAIADCLAGYGIAKSSLSRHWQVATAAELEKLCQRPMPQDLVVLRIDGKHFRHECLVTALGVDRAGKNHMGWGCGTGPPRTAPSCANCWQTCASAGWTPRPRFSRGSTAARPCTKASRKCSASGPCSSAAACTNCATCSNTCPKRNANKPPGGCAAPGPRPRRTRPSKPSKPVCNGWRGSAPCAARRLAEGLEETLTLHRLGVNERLRNSLSSTNLIESCYARTEAWTGRVKRWRNARMVLRWGAAALLVAEQGFRRLRGHEHLVELILALNQHQTKLVPLNKTA